MRAEMFDAIYLCREFVDFRKSIDGLSAIVEGEMKLELFSKALFVFCNRDRTRLKVLYWDRTGFALWMKRLEQERFPWPKKHEAEVVSVSALELKWLLDGYEYWKLKPHSVVDFACAS